MASDDKKNKVAVKFLVDKEQIRVVHAEADKDFVDVLFGFLTLPMGTIVRILHKQSSVGCMDNLYESVEKLDIHHFQTEACKTMLLHPRSEAALCYEDLEVNIDDTKPRDVYVCKDDVYCCGKNPSLFSSIQNTPCAYCKQTMGIMKMLPKRYVEPFVKKGVTYIISDDLHVQPASMIHTLSLLKKMDIQGRSVFEERHMDIGTDEILALLKRSLVSKMPLTDFYYNKDATDVFVSHNLDERKLIQVKTEASEDPSGGISIKLLFNKVDRRVLCAEVGGNFLNQVFSFLTLPLSSLIKFLDKNSAMVCVDNLYASVENLGSDYFQSEECRSMLLSPKLAPFFGCSNSVLKVNESKPQEFSSKGYSVGYNPYEYATHFKELNPKSPQGESAMGGVYVKGYGKFVVTNDLCYSQFSTRLTVQILTEQGSSFGNIVEKEVRVAEVEVLKLLRAAINSTTPLTDVFSLVRI